MSMNLVFRELKPQVKFLWDSYNYIEKNIHRKLRVCEFVCMLLLFRKRFIVVTPFLSLI